MAADAGRMRQLLHNLIKNALEACAEEPVPLGIEHPGLDGERFNGVELRVRDYGPGFAEDVMGRLFEPYVTTKPEAPAWACPSSRRLWRSITA